MTALQAPDPQEFEDCIKSGGIVLFPADTVYGLACDPDNERAVERLFEIKGRPGRRPAAVMFFQLERALAKLSWLGPRTVTAVGKLLPGPVTVVVPNPHKRYPLALPIDADTLGIRVPAFEGELERLEDVRSPVLQSSANLSGQPDASRLEDVDPLIGAAADLVIDGGGLPGLPSTVVDLTSYERDQQYIVLRAGILGRGQIDATLFD